MERLEEQLKLLQARLEVIQKSLDIPSKRKRLRELEAESLKPDFWQDNEKARKTMQEINFLQEEISGVESVSRAINDALSVSREAGLEVEVERAVRDATEALDKLETTTFLSGRYDKNDAIVSIHAGQGGTEAMDWAQMLLRMYLRYGQRKDWGVEVVDQTPGEEAGIKSGTLIISAPFAYGYLKGEAGTHRLVRQSPFNADQLRQTSFALVEVMPALDEAPDIEIKDDDLEWQFFRASSQGGQNVQKVSTAVRLTHKPTGIVVTAQTERFQEQNRKIALDLLRSKLWARRELAEKEQAKAIKGEYRPASWGTQIRSYVLHPYKMVKDLRTDVETSNTESVLDGDLDEFIDAELRHL
ncbi:MAG: peptide chain release factor 2 [Candidatus Blackburnbacteria bacterium]|nr:peptide chain release factor 2 [Candidatus Blackburnbacteria bacterium]